MVNVEELFWQQMLKNELFPRCFFLKYKQENYQLVEKNPNNFFSLKYKVNGFVFVNHRAPECRNWFWIYFTHFISIKNITNFIEEI